MNKKNDNITLPEEIPAADASPPDDAPQGLLSLIAERTLYSEYESIFLIDEATGRARKFWQNDTAGDTFFPDYFDYEETASAYFIQNGYDQNPLEVVQQLSLTTIKAMLRIQDSYYVHFYVNGEAQRLIHKKAIFFYSDETKHTICQLIRDTTQSFADERDRYLELQKAFEETQALANANTRFLKLFNRDMRTPIHSILGLVEIADNELSNPDIIRDYLYKIKSAGSSMSEIVDDILSLSRIIESHPTPQLECVSLQRRLEFLQTGIAEQLHYRGLSLHFDIQNDISDEIITDVNYLNVILQKLVLFAINNTVRGGGIRLSVRELLQKQSNTLMEFTVTSHGIDIHPEQIENLFRPNDYLMNELRNDLSSVDLNTIILKYYVAALGGSIVAQSGAGISTKITVSLKFSLPSKAASSGGEPGEMPIPDLRQYRALIVDDDPINLEVGTKLLNRTGIRTISSTNGPEALQAVQDIGGNLDVILVDIRMPGMDGLEVTKHIRQMPLPFVKRIPVIAMTVNDSDADMKRSLDAGINAHLIKPIEPADLYAVLRKYLTPEKK